MTVIVVRDLPRKLLYEMGPLGTRTDEVHLASQDIQELRDLVDAQLAEDLADARNAFVVRHGPDRIAVLLGVGAHRAELDHIKRPPVLADPLLFVEDGPP